MELTEAAFRLDVAKVQALLRSGANPNAKYGKYDKEVFSDQWKLGWSSIGSENWTALLAVVQASEWPPPPRKIENTMEDLEWAGNEAAKVPEKDRAERRERQLEIARMLIEAGADVNADDGYGATALYESAGDESGIALLLIEKGAKVNTKTGTYIDGPGDITPLQRAAGRPENLAALIQEGAALDGQDSSGRTALHRAVSCDNLASVKLLLDADAKAAIRDKEGRTPAEERLILKMLKSAKGGGSKSR